MTTHGLLSEKDVHAFCYPVDQNGSSWRFCGKNAKNVRFTHYSSEDLGRYKFIYYNQYQIKMIAVDVDDVGEIEPSYEPGLDRSTFNDVPVPNISVCSSGGHFQAFWMLKKPMPIKCSAKSMDFCNDIRMKLNIALGGDCSFNKRGGARNPFYEKYKIMKWHDDAYELSDLNLNIDLFQSFSANLVSGGDAKYEEGERNKVTFLRALYFYKRNPKISFEELLANVLAWQNIQDDENLSYPENVGIVKSVLRNGYKYKIRADRNYGAMQLPKIDWSSMSAKQRKREIKKRQRMGAKYTHKRQTEKNLKIVKNYFNQNPTASIRNAARDLKISDKTVQKYKKVV